MPASRPHMLAFCSSSHTESTGAYNATGSQFKPLTQSLCLCSARRIQNMGWTADNTLWLATRGGDVFFANKQGQASSFEQAKLGSRGFGILDVTCAPSHSSYLHRTPVLGVC